MTRLIDYIRNEKLSEKENLFRDAEIGFSDNANDIVNEVIKSNNLPKDIIEKIDNFNKFTDKKIGFTTKEKNSKIKLSAKVREKLEELNEELSEIKFEFERRKK